MKKKHIANNNFVPKILNNKQLAQLLEINLSELFPSEYASKLHDFPLKVPHAFAARMHVNTLNDPLLLQILPQAQEYNAQQENDEYKIDPLDENNCMPLPGLLHKYYGRALLLLTKNCPINCRFCFRRYTRAQIENWSQVLAYLANDLTISEIILSGGEPLLWQDDKLAWLLQELTGIKHIKRVRIHTRAPIVMPERIDNGFLHMLAKQKLPLIFVIHCNHPQEINAEVAQKLKRLRINCAALLNQTVLLKNINDDAKTLVQLSEKLFASGVLPYYLHMLDHVKGTSHFCVADAKAKILMQQIRGLLPGYLVPKLVRDVVGETAKMLL